MNARTNSQSEITIGKLAQQYCGKTLPLQVLRSQRGHYIGTADGDGPCSRESVHYWPKQEAAQQALLTGNWTQKEEP